MAGNYFGTASFIGKFMMVAFLPQMVIWIAFTVLVGTFVGTIVTALVCRGKTAPAAP
jgi:ABC-type multidrug transport system permease subunit